MTFIKGKLLEIVRQCLIDMVSLSKTLGKTNQADDYQQRVNAIDAALAKK